MPFLYLEDGEVYPTKEGIQLPQVKDVYNADKTEGKVFFKDVLKYVFYVYNREGVYVNTFEGYKKRIVIERHLPKRKIEDFENNKRVKELIKEYLDLQMSKNERLQYQLELDIEKLLERISKIPYTKIAKVKVPIEDDEGNITYISTPTEIDNTKEKSDAMLIAEKLIDYGDKIKDKITREKIEQKKKSSKERLFDKSSK